MITQKNSKKPYSNKDEIGNIHIFEFTNKIIKRLDRKKNPNSRSPGLFFIKN